MPIKLSVMWISCLPLPQTQKAAPVGEGSAVPECEWVSGESGDAAGGWGGVCRVEMGPTLARRRRHLIFPHHRTGM